MPLLGASTLAAPSNCHFLCPSRYFSKVMSQQLGGKPYDGTWESFVSLSRRVLCRFHNCAPAALAACCHTPATQWPYAPPRRHFVLILLPALAQSREIMRGRNTREQQEVVAGVLAGLLPPQAPARFRRWCGRWHPCLREV